MTRAPNSTLGVARTPGRTLAAAARQQRGLGGDREQPAQGSLRSPPTGADPGGQVASGPQRRR